jgi:hypothetical protein
VDFEEIPRLLAMLQVRFGDSTGGSQLESVG